jgi:serine/threonine-protein kinase
LGTGRTCDETQTGQLKGKLAYMAPEQLGRADVNARTDIFAAGIVMWEMLTARRLFRGADVLQTIELVRTLEVPDPRTAVASVPEALAAVVMRALDREPERRFASAAEMADAIEQACAPAAREEVGSLVMRVFPSRLQTPTPTPSFATIVDLAEDVAPATITSVPLTPPFRPRRAWPLLCAAALLLVAIVRTSGVFEEADAHSVEIRARTKAPPVITIPPPPPVQVAAPAPTVTPIPTMTLTPTPTATHKRAPHRDVPHLKHPNPYGT